MKPDEYDYSWLREWRLPLNEYAITKDDIVIVDTFENEEEIMLDFQDVDIDAEPEDGGCTSFYYGIYKEEVSRDIN